MTTTLPWGDMIPAAFIPIAWLAVLAGVGGWRSRHDENGTGLPFARLFLALSLSAGMTWQAWPTGLQLAGVLIWAGSTLACLVVLPFALPDGVERFEQARGPQTHTDAFFEYLEPFAANGATLGGIAAAVLVASGWPWMTASFTATLAAMVMVVASSWLQPARDKARAARYSLKS